MECHGQNSASGCNVIREVFVKKNLLPEVLVCIWQFEAFLFIFLPLPVNCSNLLFGEILLLCLWCKSCLFIIFRFYLSICIWAVKEYWLQNSLESFLFRFSFFFSKEHHLVMYKYNARCLDQVLKEKECCHILFQKKRKNVVISLSIGIEDSSYNSNMCLDRINELVSIKHLCQLKHLIHLLSIKR